jgi:hypothetical protein
MNLFHGQIYNDDRLFILDLQLAKKNKKSIWAVTTRGNVDGLPPFRVDDFPTMEAAIAFIQKIEPETPRISMGGKPPQQPLEYTTYIAELCKEGIPSAIQIYEMNKANRGELIVDELTEGDLQKQ